ncbi:MAG: hypothetical protein AB8I08_19590 [Sandaracinaceae bacterium]
MRFFAWFLPVLLFGATGCETTMLTVDGGPGVDANGVAPGMLTLLSEPSASLVTGEMATIAVRYTESGSPVADAEVNFALIGTAHDSALQNVSLRTSLDGRAETVVTAGTIAAAFRVRATGRGAEPMFVNVAVSTEGFGTLRAVTEYEGRRAEEATRVFRVYSETECDPEDGYPTFADRSVMIEADDEDVEARWSLPVGLSYTVVAELRMNDIVVADGCVDDISLTADAETEATVTLLDQALRPDGRYDGQLTLRPGAAGTRVIEHALLGGRDAVGDSGAGWFLDALEAELRDRGKITTADTLLAARETQETGLALALDDVAVGPLEAINRLGARLETQLAVVALGGPIALSTDDRVLGGVWALDTLRIGASGPDSPPSIDVPLDDLAPMPRLELTWRPEADVIDLAALTLSLRLGALLATVLDAELAAADTPGMLVEDGAGCVELAAWIAADGALAGDCDADCAAAVCVRALDPVANAVRDRLRGDEALRESLVLSGTLATTDEDADILVDRIEGRGLTGVWLGVSDEDPVTADLVGQRLLE